MTNVSVATPTPMNLYSGAATPRAEARDWLLGLGFVQSSVDPLIFCKRRPSPHNNFCLLGLYVDDSLGA